MNSIRLLYGVPDQKIALVYNGVDYDFWNPNLVKQSEINERKNTYNPLKKTMCLYYGHAGKSKGLDLLLQSIPNVIKEEPDFLFVFNIIDSRRKSLLISRLHDLQKYGYKKHIHIFYGMDKVDLRTLVSSSDVVVAPSLSEGFGSVHTEVMAMQKPLITTFIASIPEVVSGKVIFVPPGSSDAIAKALLAIKKNQSIFADTPTLSFHWDDTVSQLSKLYN